jgi:hypothetical protein
MVQHPAARVLQKFINLHRTQLQSYLFIYFIFIFNLNHTTWWAETCRVVEDKNKNKINK